MATKDAQQTREQAVAARVQAEALRQDAVTAADSAESQRADAVTQADAAEAAHEHTKARLADAKAKEDTLRSDLQTITQARDAASSASDELQLLLSGLESQLSDQAAALTVELAQKQQAYQSEKNAREQFRQQSQADKAALQSQIDTLSADKKLLLERLQQVGLAN